MKPSIRLNEIASILRHNRSWVYSPPPSRCGTAGSPYRRLPAAIGRSFYISIYLPPQLRRRDDKLIGFPCAIRATREANEITRMRLSCGSYAIESVHDTRSQGRSAIRKPSCLPRSPLIILAQKKIERFFSFQRV